MLRLTLDIGFDADDGTIRSGMKDFRAAQMPRERRGEGQHRGEADVLDIFGLVGVLAENPSRP